MDSQLPPRESSGNRVVIWVKHYWLIWGWWHGKPCADGVKFINWKVSKIEQNHTSSCSLPNVQWGFTRPFSIYFSFGIVRDIVPLVIWIYTWIFLSKLIFHANWALEDILCNFLPIKLAKYRKTRLYSLPPPFSCGWVGRSRIAKKRSHFVLVTDQLTNRPTGQLTNLPTDWPT